MAQRTIARLYDSYDDATAVVRSLENSGIPHADISIVGRDAEGRTDATTLGTNRDALHRDTATTAYEADRSYADSDTVTHSETAAAATGTGATIGTVLGGGAGLLAGIGALAIPGVGPVVAAGWLIATLTGAGVGAAAGGLVGGLTGSGMSHEEAHVYNEGVRRGGTLVTVHVDDSAAPRVEEILAERHSVDWRTRDEEWRAGGWTGTDEAVAIDPTGPLGGVATVPPVDPAFPGARPAFDTMREREEVHAGMGANRDVPGDMRGFASNEGRYGGKSS